MIPETVAAAGLFRLLALWAEPPVSAISPVKRRKESIVKKKFRTLSF